MRSHPVTRKRKEQGLTAYALAKKIGISASHLRSIETGTIAVPGVDLALRIAAVLKVDVTDLFGDSARKSA